MRIIFVCLVILFNGVQIYSQSDKLNDFLNKKMNQKKKLDTFLSKKINQENDKQGKSYIVFCAKEGVPGHAFVGFGKEDEKKSMCTYEAWGLCPKDRTFSFLTSAVISSLTGGIYIGPFPGSLADDFLTKADAKLILSVNESQYDNALKIKKEWEGKSYTLLESDCVSFLIAVAKTISNLSIPPRTGYDNLPVNYLIKMIDLNKKSNKSSNSFTDTRDGKTYKIIKIGSQVWMAENLAYNTGSGCWAYDNNSGNVAKYGYLYTWEAAKRACPPGWHLPSDDEWSKLANLLGGEDAAGKKIKSTSGWESYGNGTNESGFSALPGGSRGNDGGFYDRSGGGYWWSATELDASSAGSRSLRYYGEDLYRGNNDKSCGFSVRLLRDSD